MNKNKKLGFTLAEVLIVIGIIGVVAALTLPNLNHATGDKETVTRVLKAYSILNEANDRAIATYGPISAWTSCQDGDYELSKCWMKRVSEFMKITKKCDEISGEDSDSYSNCDDLNKGDMHWNSGPRMITQLADGTSFAVFSSNPSCNMDYTSYGSPSLKDVCISGVYVDINGPTKGKNSFDDDMFWFDVSDSLGVIAGRRNLSNCMTIDEDVPHGVECTWWVLEFGNLDYKKQDGTGKCNDSGIILDGVTNTSCH